MYQPIERTTKVMLDLENIVIYEDVPQRSDLWFKLRSGHLTASNFDRLITPKTGKPSAQQDDLIIELCCSCLRPDEITFEGNFHTDRGEALEQEARELFATLTGKAVKPPNITSIPITKNNLQCFNVQCAISFTL